jgi:uncharacterized membrane protein
MGTAGCILGIINILSIIIVFTNMNGLQDYFNSNDNSSWSIFLLAYFVITIVVAITGFLVSKSSYSKGQEGAGIAGMALNGLIILPVIIFFIGSILEAFGKKKKYE